MRDKRSIIIKSPRLQRIRNNLRDVFFQAARSERKRLYNEWRGFLVDPEGKRRSINNFSPEELSRFRQLQERENEITDMINRSILTCAACGKGHRDMVYNKAYDAWYCTECYGLERVTAQRRAKARARNPNKAKSCEEKVIESHSKTFL